MSALEKFLSHAIEASAGLAIVSFSCANCFKPQVLNLVAIIQQTDTLSQIAQVMDSGDRFVLETNSFKDLLVTVCS